MKFNYWQTLLPGCFYHIYNRAVDKDRLFRTSSDYQYFLKKYTEYLYPYLDTYAYCLMPNHFHFIVKLKPDEECTIKIEEEVTLAAQNYVIGKAKMNDFLTDQMRRLFSSYVLKYNYRNSRKGPLISPKVKRVSISNDDRLKYLIAYLHHNPIHHGINRNYSEWRYSSFNAIQSSSQTLLARDSVLELFNGLESFNDFHKEFRIMKVEENIDR